MTISLPPHRQERLLTLLGTITKRKRASVQEWHQLLGELRSMSIAIPGSRGCFSFLQHALRPGAKRIHITQPVRDQLLDFLHLAQDVTSRPTHIAEVVPTPPTYYGSMDAAKAGMGGVWFPPGPPEPNTIHPHRSSRLQAPILWRQRFSPQLQSLLVSFDNPTGTISNSDLELAGTIAHDDILSNATSVAHLGICGLTDNTPAMAWRRKYIEFAREHQAGLFRRKASVQIWRFQQPTGIRGVTPQSFVVHPQNDAAENSVSQFASGDHPTRPWRYCGESIHVCDRAVVSSRPPDKLDRPGTDIADIIAG